MRLNKLLILGSLGPNEAYVNGKIYRGPELVPLVKAANDRLTMYPAYPSLMRNVVRTGVGTTIEGRDKDNDLPATPVIFVNAQTMKNDADVISQCATKNGGAFGLEWTKREMGSRDFKDFFPLLDGVK